MLFNVHALCTCAVVLSTATDVVGSRLTYVSEVQRWVTHKKVVSTWQEAKTQCEREGLLLASPISTQLLQHILSYTSVNNHSIAYFIGVKLRYNPEPQFVSIEGILVEDMPDAAIDMIDQLDPRDGDCLAMERESIRAVPCWSRLPYMCYSNVSIDTDQIKSEPVTTDATMLEDVATNVVTSVELGPIVEKCAGAGYEFSPSTGSCYKLHNELISWAQANQTCNKEGAYLVIVNDENEKKTIQSMVTSSWVWVGPQVEELLQRLNVKGNNLEHFDDGGLGKQNENNIKNTCSALDFEGELVELKCEDIINFVCEKKK